MMAKVIIFMGMELYQTFLFSSLYGNNRAFAKKFLKGNLFTYGAVLISGIIPMIFVMYTAAPFVTYVHLRLPPFARISRTNLMRYSANLPKDASIYITTMNIIGRPHVSRVNVSELYPIKKPLNIANFARDTKEISSKRPWWARRYVRRFAILETSGATREKGIWENVVRSIRNTHNRPAGPW
jgi:hypothetical protein